MPPPNLPLDTCKSIRNRKKWKIYHQNAKQRKSTQRINRLFAFCKHPNALSKEMISVKDVSAMPKFRAFEKAKL
jgi:hypothetical protein